MYHKDIPYPYMTRCLEIWEIPLPKLIQFCGNWAARVHYTPLQFVTQNFRLEDSCLALQNVTSEVSLDTLDWCGERVWRYIILPFQFMHLIARLDRVPIFPSPIQHGIMEENYTTEQSYRFPNSKSGKNFLQTASCSDQVHICEQRSSWIDLDGKFRFWGAIYTPQNIR